MEEETPSIRVGEVTKYQATKHAEHGAAESMVVGVTRGAPFTARQTARNTGSRAGAVTRGTQLSLRGTQATGDGVVMCCSVVSPLSCPVETLESKSINKQQNSRRGSA